MAEEDEIDILGDCSLDKFLTKSEPLFDTPTTSDLLKCDDSILVSQNSDLLKCDYTIHPQWLLDKPSTNPACWYSTTTTEFTSDIPPQPEVPQISSENSITDESGWTEKEKNLLYRGIEIFGKSNVRLSQFIGSKSSSEVKYYLKNFYSEVQGASNYDILNDFMQETVVSSENAACVPNKEVLDDAEIPASIEEVIEAVTTAVPTIITNTGKKNATNPKVNYYSVPSGHSLLKKNYMQQFPQPAQSHIRKQRNKPTAKRNNLKQKKVKLKENKVINKKQKNLKRTKGNKLEMITLKNNDFKASDIEIVTGKGLSVPVCSGEEVIKIKKGDDVSDSDIEIDITDSGDEAQENKSDNLPKEDNTLESKACKVDSPEKIDEKVPSGVGQNSDNVEQKKVLDLTELCEDDVNFLKSMDFPKSEYFMDPEKISDLEKFIHCEFFEGRPTKTPMRYLKIRNHILNAWKDTKPNYVLKTSIRQGLKQCGDVNCIGRIHQFLEQIGAINFKCPQTSYVRPLSEFVLTLNNTVREKKENENLPTISKSDAYYRNRNKKKYIHDGEGGCTLQHNESGDVINTTVINEDPTIKKPYIRKTIVRLIYCKSFNEEFAQEYKVEINLTTILLMDFHAHTSLSEVMGLVGGRWDPHTKILTITRYEPCKNLVSSSTHCDMCPITQARAADTLHGEGLEILGWYHSHPTFAPEPSQQDIDSQLTVQHWIGHGKPCVGIILTPFSPHGALIASPYRCMVVLKKPNFDDQFVPYRLKVDVCSSGICVDDLLIYAKKIHNYSCSDAQSKLDFAKPYFQDTTITYSEKFISSVKMYLAKCSDISKTTCDAIVQGFTDICGNG